MMYRKLNLLNHLKAMRVFYLCGEADLTESFGSQLFHKNQECTLKDNSLFFLNSCFEMAISALRTNSKNNNTNSNLLFPMNSLFA